MVNLLQNKDFIIFDFDGVIIDSINIKGEAYRYALKEYDNNDVERLLNYHKENKGVSREEKFKYFYRDVIMDKKESSKLSDHLKAFSIYISKHSFNDKFLIYETIDFIKKIYQKKGCYIASASYIDELKQLCNFFNISKYFTKIYGGPMPKGLNIATIVGSNDPKRYVMIGDGKKDYSASKLENDVDFIGYNNINLKKLGIGYIDSFKTLDIQGVL